MEWLSQNWIWIVFGIGALVFMTSMGGCGVGHSSHRHSREEGRDTPPPATGNHPGNLFDPVSGRSFPERNAQISTIYRGRAFYFESRENRDVFEANPEKFLASGTALGEPMQSERNGESRYRHHHGC